ncbi:hypothetical protein TA3x_004609 [Tundrisphaera sp. TA3]|uniref:hypothetical protein n=1 Tax=Tundrisphaera sp. TA3 TaxID=3435775 RepID=UPI003EBFDC5C
MTETITRLAYRLEPGDLTGVLASQRRCWCRSHCLRWVGSLSLLAPIAVVLALASARSGGFRAVAVEIAGVAGILLLAALVREGLARLRCREFTRLLGLPRDVALLITPDGVVLEPDADGIGRTYAWSEIAQVSHHGQVSLVHLRVAGSALLIPDRAFPTPAERHAVIARMRDAIRTSGPMTTAAS